MGYHQWWDLMVKKNAMSWGSMGFRQSNMEIAGNSWKSESPYK
jgi:hypothetical protein